MSDKSKIGLVVRRAKALIQSVIQKTAAHEEAVRAQKAGGKHAGGGPTLRDFTGLQIALADAVEQYEGTTGHEHIPFKSELLPGVGDDTQVQESHESFGMLSFHRGSGGRGATHLFGSHVEYHPVTIRLEVKRAVRSFSKDLSYDSIYARETLIEVELSAAQFTDSITLMNHGDGIPCTLRYVGGVQMEDVPDDHRSEQHKIVEGFKEQMSAVRESAKPQLEKLQTILAKKAIGKKDREEIAWLFEKLTRNFSDNAAFTMSQFNEATSKLETEAKKEVEAYAQSILVGAGIEHLRGQAPDPDALVGESPRAIEGKKT